MGRLGIKIPKNTFKKAKEAFQEGGEFADDVELEPGRYVAILEKMEPVETSKGANLVARCTLVGEAEQAGGRVSVWFSLDDDRLVWLYRLLTKLGYDVDAIDSEDDLADIVDQIEQDKLVIRLSAKRKGEYVNVFIDKVIEELSASEARAEAGLTEEDEEEEEEEEGDPLEAMSRAELKKAAKEAGLSLKITTKTTDEEIRDALRAASEEEEEEAEEEEEEDEEEEEGEVDADTLAAMSRDELKTLSQERKLGIRFTKGKNDDVIRAQVAEKLGIELEEEEEEEEDPEDGEEEEGELTIGDKCICTIRGKEIEDCVVVSIDEDAGQVKVKRGDTGKVAVVSADKIAI